MSFLSLNEDWEYNYIPNLVKGLNTTQPANLLDDSALVQANNIFYEDGLIKKDSGYTLFTTSTIIGIPRVTYQFYKKDGSSELMLVTNSTLYRLILGEWAYVSDGNSTTTTNDEVAGQTVIEVPSTTGFSVSDYIGIGLSDGTQHRTTIASISAGVSITVDEAIPSGKNTGVGATVLKAVDLSGSLDIQLSMITLASHDWFVFTNGIDNPKRFDGTDCVNIPNLPESGNTQCRLVSVFENHLILAHTTEAGNEYPQRVRRSDTGNPTEWSTGNAGYTDLYDSEDFLVAIAHLGPYMILYRERSIVRTTYVGSTDLLFDFDTTVSGEGALSQDSVLAMGDFHIFIGNSNIYKYRGGFDFESLGEDIYSQIFGRNGELNPTYRNRVFGLYVEELDEAWIFYPSTGSSVPNKLLRQRQDTKAWTTRTLNEGIYGFGLYQATTDRTIDQLVGTIDDQDWEFNSSSILNNSPTTHLLGASNIYEYDYLAIDDNGTDIAYTIVTKDFGHPRFKTRFDLFEFRLFGTSVLVEYSIDEGVTWITLGTITSTTLVRNILNKQIVSQYLRLRLSGTSNFKLQSIGFMYIMESEL